MTLICIIWCGPLIIIAGVIGHGSQTDAQILSTLQHHGAATTFLDFTRSPLVALWFACRGNSEHSDKAGVVFAVDIHDWSDARGSDIDWLNKLPLGNLYYEPDHGLSPRIIAQQSVFVVCNPDFPSSIVSAKIPSNIKDKLRKELRRWGVSEDILFPDLPYLAERNKACKPLPTTFLDRTQPAPDAPDTLALKRRGERAFHQKQFQTALAYFENYASLPPTRWILIGSRATLWRD
ncbi:MAG: FRG domain-containing protein [Rhodobacteraceae bacterium]|nr:FRG domain-containing protein [Paracoccaceae bacterium]MCY4196962.1 FRG domain-containing protein [Paracoccaceae bacterium]